MDIVKNDFIVLDGLALKVKHATEKALLVSFNRGDQVARFVDVWLPKSCFIITNIKEYADGGREVFCTDLPNWCFTKLKGF